MAVQQWPALDAGPGPRLGAVGGRRPGVEVAALPGSLGLSVMGRPSTGKGRRTSSPSGFTPARTSLRCAGPQARRRRRDRRTKGQGHARPGRRPPRAVVHAGPRRHKRLTESAGERPAPEWSMEPRRRFHVRPASPLRGPAKTVSPRRDLLRWQCSPRTHDRRISCSWYTMDPTSLLELSSCPNTYLYVLDFVYVDCCPRSG